MPDGDGDALLLQPLIEGVEAPLLGARPAQVQAVGGGEMAEQALGLQTRQPGRLGADRRIRPGTLEAQTAHARIHRQVEFRRGPLAHCLLRQKLRILQTEDGRTDAQGHDLGIGRGGGVAQDQNGLLQPRLPQLQGLAHAGHAEEGHPFLQQPGDLHRAVAVGVGLDDGHDRGLGLAPDRLKIGQDGILIDVHIGVVIQQGDHLLKCAYFCYVTIFSEKRKPLIQILDETAWRLSEDKLCRKRPTTKVGCRPSRRRTHSGAI